MELVSADKSVGNSLYGIFTVLTMSIYTIMKPIVFGGPSTVLLLKMPFQRDNSYYIVTLLMKMGLSFQTQGTKRFIFTRFFLTTLIVSQIHL